MKIKSWLEVLEERRKRQYVNIQPYKKMLDKLLAKAWEELLENNTETIKVSSEEFEILDNVSPSKLANTFIDQYLRPNIHEDFVISAWTEKKKAGLKFKKDDMEIASIYQLHLRITHSN